MLDLFEDGTSMRPALTLLTAAYYGALDRWGGSTSMTPKRS
jgi:hypothetical protein